MNFFKTGYFTLIILFCIFINLAVYAKSHQATAIENKLAALEIASNGRIGIAAINTANNRHIHYRENERFAMGCTSKVIGVAAILQKSMNDSSLLQQRVFYTKKDLTNWNPITEKHVTDGMTVAELSAASISYSDNTAMNLLVEKLGGLQNMNAFARSIDDNFFRQDHDWPAEAKSGGPNDLNDSSTPAAMANSFKKIVLDNILAPYQRNLLLTWLKNTTTGDARIRAGVPKNWIVGDKTGTGFYYGITNDIAIIWPPKCAPLIVAVYFTHNKKEAKIREDVIASATKLVLNEFAQKDPCIKRNLTV